MATVAASSLSKQEHDELCCSYAALLLHDDDQEITVRTFVLTLRKRKSLKSSKLPETKLSLTGPVSSPRPSKARTSPSSLLLLDPLDLLPLPLLPPPLLMVSQYSPNLLFSR